MNPWIEFFLEVEEMRTHQKAFFKLKPGNKDRKIVMAKAKLTEMKVDQMAGKLRKLAEEKNIDLTKEQNEPEDDN